MVWRPTTSRWWVGGEGLGIPSHHPGCLVGFVVDNSGSARLVLLVTKQLAPFSPFPSSGPRCVTSWLVWMRRTEDAVAHLQAPCISQSLVWCWSGLRCTGLWTVLGDDSRNGLRIQHFLVRQWIHVWRHSSVAFGRIPYFLREGFSMVLARLALEIWTLFQQAALMTSWMGFLPHFAAFFALRPHGRERSFFSPR